MNNLMQKLILIVDDDPDSVCMLNEALDTEGFSVLVALSGTQALSILSRITPDLILLDAVMPSMDGFETCKRIKDNPRLTEIPVIFMTGLDSDSNVSQSFECGAVDYIQKPIRIVELVKRINLHIDKSKVMLSTKFLLDSNGLSSFLVDKSCVIKWYTPDAMHLLEQCGFDKMTFSSKIQSLLNPLIQKAEIGKYITIDGNSQSKERITITLSQINDEGFIFAVKRDQNVNKVEILKQKFSLTQREAEILYWVCQGKSNKDMAIILDISPRTVNKHLEAIFSKMMVENRTTAANMALNSLLSNS